MRKLFYKLCEIKDFVDFYLRVFITWWLFKKMSMQILQKVHERFSYLFNGTNQTKTLFTSLLNKFFISNGRSIVGHLRGHPLFLWTNNIFQIHTSTIFYKYRSSRPEVFRKKSVLWNFTKFTGKHLCLSVFFNKVAGLRPAKRDSGTGVFLWVLWNS